MINFNINILALLIGIIIYPFSMVMPQYQNRSIDQIPRDRLVTNDELLELLDKGIVKSEDRTSIESFVNYLKKRKSPSYFFSSKEMRDGLEEYLKKFPGEENRINNKVNEYQATYGDDIDWLLPSNDLHGRSLTPNSIRYIARFPLAFEYATKSLIDGNFNSANDFFVQLKDFINDYKKGDVESEENDVFERFYAGHRTRNILFAHNILLASEDYSVEDHIFMIKVFLLHGAKLIDTCEKFHWGNHQLHGLAGLYEMTTMYPEFPVMRFWNKLAVKTIMQHIETEIMSDGFQFERASHYYKLDIMNYFRIFKIANINGVSLPEPYMQRFNQMFEAFVNLSLPVKKLPVLQDAQDKYKPQMGKLENNNQAELNDPKETLYMTLGSMVFNNSIYKYFGEEYVPSEIYWFFTEDEREQYLEIDIEKPSIGSVGLEESKYYIMRTGWEKDSYYLLIDGGLAKHKPDHTHGGIMGIFANVNGIDVLPTYRVKYSEPTYRYLKNSFIKNVAIADNIVQGKEWKSNNARTGFGHWEILPKPTVTDWIAGETFDFFSGGHNAFDENGVKYNRSVIFFKPYFWLVVDDYKSESLHSYQQLWQGNYEILDDVNGAVKHSENSDFFIIQSDFTKMEIEPYSKFGYNSLKFEKEGVKNYSFSTILYPKIGKDKFTPIVREYERGDYKQIVVQSDSLKGVYYQNKGEDLNLDEIMTDAKYVFANYENDVLKSFLIYNGKYCSIDGNEISVEKKSVIEARINANNKLSFNIIK